MASSHSSPGPLSADDPDPADPFWALMAQPHVAMVLTDPQGRYTRVNQRWAEMLGYEMDEILSLRVQEVTHPDSQYVTEENRRQLEAGGQYFINEKKYVRKDGSAFWAITTVSALRDREGALTGYVAQITDLTAQRRGRLLVECQNEALQLLISGAPLLRVFHCIIALIEAEAEGDAVASVLLMDHAQGRLRHGAAPSLPEDYNQAIDGIAVSTELGTCAAAAARRESVITPDLGTAPGWEGLRHLPLRLGLKAAWSMPILSATGTVLGTLGTYFRRPRPPTSAEVDLVSVLVKTLALAIERRQAEDNLAAALTRVDNQRRLFETVLSNTPDLMCVFDLQHRFVYANRSMLELCRRTWDNTIGRSLAEVGLSPEDCRLQEQRLERVIATRQSVHAEVDIETSHGLRRFDCIFAPVIGADGRVEAVAGASRDITESFKAAAAGRFLASLTAEVAAMTGEHDIVSHVLATLGRHCGAHRCFFVECYESENLVKVGRNWIRDDSADLAGSYRLSDYGGQEWWHTLLRGNFFVEDVLNHPLVAAAEAAHYSALGIRSYAAHPSKAAGNCAVVLAMTEVHPRKWTPAELRLLGEVAARIWPVVERSRTEEALKIARDQAVAASKAKDHFLARLSHELRTPLNPAMLRASEAAAEEGLPARMREDFRMIEGCIRHEVRLIDDLLDITRIAHDKLDLRLSRQEVGGLLERSLAMVEMELAEKGLTLTRDFTGAPMWVSADEARLQQVFSNLLKNAVKFTPAGGWIRVSIQPSPARPGFVVIAVSDSGYGLTSAELELVFEPFAQGEHRDGRSPHRFGGLGLGLAISRKIAEMHAGRISAQSAGRHQGATFLVELPLADAVSASAGAGGAVAAPRPQTARFQRILLVEDHEPSRRALAEILQRRGIAVIQSGSVAEALERIGAGACDLVISDLGLPDGSGYELMSRLRADFGSVGIALTGYGTEEDIELSKKAGFVLHLVKPVRVSDLEAALARCAELGPARVPRPA